jgi:hypothetical protein
MKQQTEEKLVEYGNLPIKKFSNSQIEKSANYQRIPPIGSIDYIGSWYQTMAATSIINGDDAAYQYIGVANGYNQLSFLSQVSAFNNKMIDRCYILRDWGAKHFFALAAAKNENEINQVMLDLKVFNDARYIHDLGSKVAIFAVAIIDLLLGESLEKSLSHFNEVSTDFMDTTGALDVYKTALITFESGNSGENWNDVINNMLLVHQKESKVSQSDDECFDYSDEAWAAIPYEVIGYANLVAKKFNISVDFPDTELGCICNQFAGRFIPIEYDAIARRVLDRAQKVLFQPA